MAGGLLTDLYELNMAASYLRRGVDGIATFSLFVPQTLDAGRRRFEADLERAPAGALRVDDPEPPQARFSEALRELTGQTRTEALRRVGL